MLHERNAGLHGFAENLVHLSLETCHLKRGKTDDKEIHLLVLREGSREQRGEGVR